PFRAWAARRRDCTLRDSATRPGRGARGRSRAAGTATGPTPNAPVTENVMKPRLHHLFVPLLAACSATPALAQGGPETIFANGFEPPPNILLVILDDVGVDQMPSFGYGGAAPPRMPTFDAIAYCGLRFRY